ncbi:MAG TPA: protein kinase, partial [Thermoanaerobaculia bacterium]|nr:protein kinase [Thermoanaerobaculia bacterium]
MTLSAGTRLGPYEILSPLGAGGMGEVYRARDERLEREVAIKVLPASYSSDPDRLHRFELEAKAAGRLNHPNILAIYDVGTRDGAPYVVSELLDGQTLRERLATAGLPARKAVDVALQLARGLAAAHEKGIVHRDLKPENVFLTSDGRVKILDFGLAKLTRPESSTSATAAPTETRGTEPGVVLGTVGYMSPEQVRGQPADGRSDIFTFGSILYEMLSGRRAFRGDSSADVLSAILKEEPPPLAETGRGVPPPLERLVAHCLEKNPEERFQSARDLAYDLEALSGLSPSAVATPYAGAAPRVRRIPLLAAALAAVVVAAAGVLAGRASKPDRPPPPIFHRLTFRRGSIGSARFAPDGQSVVYSAKWDGGPAQLFLKRPETPDAIPLALPPSEILAISPAGEMTISLDCRVTHQSVCSGTLAQAPLTGGAPHAIQEHVQDADWAPDGSAMVLVHDVGGRSRLEYPAGKVLYETSGHVSFPRVSPRGDRIAFLDHPQRIDDRGSVAVLDLAGKKTTLAGPFGSAAGVAWDPSSTRIWFTASKEGTQRGLFAVSLSGGLRSVLTAAGSLTLRDISKSGN